MEQINQLNKFNLKDPVYVLYNNEIKHTFVTRMDLAEDSLDCTTVYYRVFGISGDFNQKCLFATKEEVLNSIPVKEYI